MRGEVSERRRYLTAYACSIVIHALALAALAVVLLQSLEFGGAAETAIPDTALEVRTETAPPVVRPRPRPIAKRLPPPVVPRELARIRPHATPEPPPATPEPTAPPQPVAIAQTLPTAAPTERPTVAPTERPTIAPTERPTVAPTEHPTETPTERPTEAPAARATEAPTARPAGTIASAAAASPGPAAPVAVRTAAPAAAAPAPVRQPPAAAVAGPAGGLASLNDRLRAALPTTPTAGMQRVDLGGYSAERVLDAYEASLAPPLEILAKTFGLIYTTRTVTHADSIAYVYERTEILGHAVCRAYQITEHPLRPVAVRSDHIGPGEADFPAPLSDVKPQIDTVIVPCDSPAMIKVAPGSITTPVPRHLQN